MNINTQLTIVPADLFDAIESHIEEFVNDLDYCNATEVDNVVGYALKGEMKEYTARLDAMEITLRDIRAEDADTLRGIAQDVIDGNGFIDEDELSDRIDGFLEEDDLTWRVDDIIADADLMTEDEVRDLIDEKIDDNRADDKEMLRRYGDDLNTALDMLRRQREEMEGLQAEIAMAMNEAMIARRSVSVLLDRQPRERIRNAYWVVRNFMTNLLTRKG